MGATLEDALKRMVRYSSMITTAVTFVLEDRGTLVRLIGRPNPEEVHRPAATASSWLENLTKLFLHQ